MRSVFANLIVLLVVGLWLKRKPGERSLRLEAIEVPDEATAYARMSSWPQFRFIRWLVMRELSYAERQGLAVDVGSGPGELALLLARQSPNLQVIGVEPSPEMVALAGEKASAAGLGERVTFRAGSAEAIPVPDAGADLVVSTMSLHHWRDPAAGLREVGRVVRPGGRYLVVDLRRDIAVLPWAILNFVERYVIPESLRYVGEPTGSVRAAFTPEEAEQLAIEAGLKDFVVRTGPAWLAVDGIGW